MSLSLQHIYSNFQGIWYIWFSTPDGQHYGNMMLRNVSKSEKVSVTLGKNYGKLKSTHCKC